MAKEIVNLTKKAYNKNQYPKVIDTEFTQLLRTQVSLPEISIEERISIFFLEYEDLFYDITPLGEFKTHEYIVKKSGDYIGNSIIDDTIAELIAEVTQLREENLELQQELANLQSQQALDSAIESAQNANNQ
jgi:FtsZ-binding cell division protein ZapB